MHSTVVLKQMLNKNVFHVSKCLKINETFLILSYLDIILLKLNFYSILNLSLTK